MDGANGLEWMAWTPISAAFFIGIALMLAGMTAWGVLRPTSPHKGFLPIVTTRGDRLFIGLLIAAYLHLAWLLFTEDLLWIASIGSLGVLLAVLRWG
jgi:predicted small integral membrane protein